MGTRLRNAKKTNKGIGGKERGKLTDKIIRDLTVYNGLVILRHSNSVEQMQKAIWATFYHKSPTDEHPKHDYCPSGENSWCHWKQATVKGTLESFKHDPPFTDKVLRVIKPIYEALTTEHFLTRCLGAENQNNNESLNSLIWTFSPKHLHSGGKFVEISNFLAAIISTKDSRIF